MAEEQGQKKVDEEWKRRAREEAEKLDAERDSAGRAAQEPGGAAFPQIEASFETLVQSFVTEALIAMGDVPNPYTGQRTRNIMHAKYAIDMLQLISDKTQGNLSPDEKRLLDGALFDLRMRFIRK